MAQTFNRINKTRKEEEYSDQRRSLNNKQERHLSKHRNTVYDLATLVDDEDDDNWYDDDQH